MTDTAKTIVVMGYSLGDILLIAGFVTGLAGLGLSSFLSCLERQRYRVTLKMRVMETKLFDRKDIPSAGKVDRYFGIALRIALVNPASRGRTLYYVDLESPNKTVSPLLPLRVNNTNQVRFQLPSATGNDQPIELPFDKCLLAMEPIDIPPNESRGLWYVVSIHAREPNGSQTSEPNPTFNLKLTVKDVYGRNLTSFEGDVQMNTQILSQLD
ncbi:MAG: hypothetical protein HY532_07920 [Chloroflexi bacterium]|nr:hypothetical protein [Chloroflexota bacterium]